MTSSLYNICLIKRQMQIIMSMNQLFNGHALFVRDLLIVFWREGYWAGLYASEPHPRGLWAARRVCEAQMEGWRSWIVWKGRVVWCGWTNGPSVCSERLSGWTWNLPGTEWLTGRRDTSQRRRWRSPPSPQMIPGRVRCERPAVNRWHPKQKLWINSSHSRVWGRKQISHI